MWEEFENQLDYKSKQFLLMQDFRINKMEIDYGRNVYLPWRKFIFIRFDRPNTISLMGENPSEWYFKPLAKFNNLIDAKNYLYIDYKRKIKK